MRSCGTTLLRPDSSVGWLACSAMSAAPRLMPATTATTFTTSCRPQPSSRWRRRPQKPGIASVGRVGGGRVQTSTSRTNDCADEKEGASCCGEVTDNASGDWLRWEGRHDGALARRRRATASTKILVTEALDDVKDPAPAEGGEPGCVPVAYLSSITASTWSDRTSCIRWVPTLTSEPFSSKARIRTRRPDVPSGLVTWRAGRPGGPGGGTTVARP